MMPGRCLFEKTVMGIVRHTMDRDWMPRTHSVPQRRVPLPDAIAPNWLRSRFSLPRTDLDLPKAPTVSSNLYVESDRRYSKVSC